MHRFEYDVQEQEKNQKYKQSFKIMRDQNSDMTRAGLHNDK